MKKIILIDGNNLMFRSYYATAYTGNVMKNSKGFPTNALYGFVGMMNKIIHEEKPEYVAVAFDIGKNFRKQKYETYKDGRSETPDELKQQMPIAREILNAMGIQYFEMEPYEADDIIGTFAKMCEEDPEYEALIVSSDKDLLQLISDETEVKLLKQKDYIRYNKKNFKEDWGFEPIRMIDYKALAGDPSDNIPGVKGIGDKTAINLLTQYETIEDIYEHIDEIKGKMKEKLETDKENAFISKEIATIYRDVPLNVNLDDVVYKGPDYVSLNKLFEDLEFYSFIKKNVEASKPAEQTVDFINVKSIDDLSKLDSDVAVYIECDAENYHDANIVGVGVADSKNNYFIPNSILEDVISIFKDKNVYTFDQKKNYVLLKKEGMELSSLFDTMIAAYLLNINIKDDIAYLMNNNGCEVNFYSNSLKNGFDKKDIILKARFIYDIKDEYIDKLKDEEMYELFTDIEMPLITVLANMEYDGVKVDASILKDMEEEMSTRISDIEQEIYTLVGEEFNISSPKQLGVILFEKLELPGAKKTKTGYKTDVSVLQKLVGNHPVIEKILEYRRLTKIKSTYLEGLSNYIREDGKIHTIYKQNLTRTGRLSSVEPNLQNIPARDEEGRMIRKAFLPVNDIFLSADYSQMELRVLAHVSGSKELQQAFINDEDIHTRVAADIYGISMEEVTKLQRKTAKAVIFGIVYGISGFGLGENLEISPKEAKEFIDKYYELYPGVKNYMDNIVMEAYRDGYVKTLFNRKRVIEELQNKNFMVRQSGERIALNTPIQGTSADIMKIAMVKIFNEMKEKGIKSKMLLQVHDELIFDVLEEEKETLEEIVRRNMETCVKLDVPFKVSHDYGTDWYEAK
ncbi:MAG: DNA polymerase I [Firmicutes bacterium]|nr:DNA polymerase I [Bacillota bacterium]